jgi:hypothetical protein
VIVRIGDKEVSALVKKDCWEIVPIPHQTYSPVVKMPRMRIFLAIVAINDLKRHQLDVNAKL